MSDRGHGTTMSPIEVMSAPPAPRAISPSRIEHEQDQDGHDHEQEHVEDHRAVEPFPVA